MEQSLGNSTFNDNIALRQASYKLQLFPVYRLWTKSRFSDRIRGFIDTSDRLVIECIYL